MSQAIFTTNDYYEQLLMLKATKPNVFASLSPVSKLSLVEYESQKRESEVEREAPVMVTTEPAEARDAAGALC